MDELAALCQKPRPALGSSDHNVILLLPKYRQKFKTHKIPTKTIQVWNNDSLESDVCPERTHCIDAFSRSRINHEKDTKPRCQQMLLHIYMRALSYYVEI